MDESPERVGRGRGDDLAGFDAFAGFDGWLAWRAGALLEAQHDFLRMEHAAPQRGRMVVALDMEFFHQRLDRHPAAVAQRVDFDPGLSGPLVGGLAHRGLRVVAGFLGIKFLGAGVERAKSARAAERGPLVPIIRAGGGEGEAAHDLVRFDRVAEQKARAILGAVAALVARGFADLRLRDGGFELPLDGVMRARQNHDAGGSFGDGRVEIVGRFAHHQSAEAQHRVVGERAARRRDALAEADADGNGERDRLPHGSGDGECLVRHRLSIRRGSDVRERLDILHDHSDVNRQTGGRNEPARDGVDEIVFVTRRVKITEQMNADTRSLARGFDGFDGFLLLRLDSDDAVVRSDCGHAQLDPAHDFTRHVLHDGRILMQQRLTLRAVRDDGVGFRGQLHMRGKAAASGADHTGQSDLIDERHEILRVAVMRDSRACVSRSCRNS